MKGDLEPLRLLLAVSECGSFSKAAARRNVEVSSVSRAIRGLETDVGAGLVDRHARGVRLTDAGASFASSARKILELHERAAIEARQAGAGRLNRLAIGIVWSNSASPLVDLVRRYSAIYPSVVVDLIEAGSDELQARVLAGRLDVVFDATEPPPLPRLKEIAPLSSIPVWLEPLAVVVPRGFGRASLGWDDLAQARLLCRPTDDWRRFRTYVENLGGPSLTFETQAVSQEGLIGLVSAGLGWTLVPANIGQTLPHEIRAAQIHSPGAALQCEAIWDKSNKNPALTRFLAVCAELYPSPTSSGARSQSPDPSP